MEAVIFRPQTGYYASLIAEAAVLWESLSHNHPFVDGNKRTAFAGLHTFLTVNGVRLTASAAEAYRFLAKLYAANQRCFDRLVPWLQGHAAEEDRQP